MIAAPNTLFTTDEVNPLTFFNLPNLKVYLSNLFLLFNGESKINSLKWFIENSGILWILLSEGGEKRLKTNINFLLEQYGFSVNNGWFLIFQTELELAS